MTNDKAAPASGSILVIGGGISGLTTALEAAEVGYEVFLVEKNPYLGGRVAQLNQYFPKLCPPACGLEINFRRIKDNPNIKVFTMAEVEKVDGTPGNYDVTLKISPRYVNENCTCCGECAKVCQTDITSEFNLNLLRRINRELNSNFDLKKFKHYSSYDVFTGAMESYLVSLEEQTVLIKEIGQTFSFDAWEPIHTEYSYKYLESDIVELAEDTGYKIEKQLYDSKKYFVDSIWRVEKVEST